MRQLRGLTALLTLVTFAATAQESYRIVESVSDCVNVRVEPRVDSDSIACLAANAPATVISSKPYWREIGFGASNHGWIAKKYLVSDPIPPVAPVPTPLPSNMWLTVNFVDVGQGDAIWIHTADDDIDGNGIFEGRNIVIDGGPYSADASNALLKYLRDSAHHFAIIDALFLTHPHDDHYSGVDTLVRHFEINDYYDPGMPGTASYQALLNSFTAPGRKVNHVHRTPGNLGTLDWGHELKAEILYSWPGSNAGLGSGNTLINNASIVLKLTYGTQSFLFMGDAEGKERSDPPATPKYAEARLLSGGTNLASTVLKIAHHGSETSSTLPFINAVNPDYVIVESGRKCFNGTHLPDMTTLARYCAHNPNVHIYRTDEGDAALDAKGAVNGDNIVLRTNGQATEVLEGTQANCNGLSTQVPDQSC